MFLPEVKPLKELVCESVIDAANMGKAPNRIILAGGYSTSAYVQKVLKEATKPETIFSEASPHARFRNSKFNVWTVDKDTLLTVLKGAVACEEELWCRPLILLRDRVGLR